MKKQEENNHPLVKYFGLLFLINWSSAVVGQSECKLRKDEDSIKIYTCNTDTSKFKSIKAKLRVNASLQQLENFLLDFANYKTWQYNTIESTVLKKINEKEFIYYTKIEAPWPVSDRDMVVHFTLVKSDKQFLATANSEKHILSEKKDFVRVPASRSQWLVKEIGNKSVEIAYEIQIDPGGNVPSWLVNWVCANAPYMSFKKLKELIAIKK